MKLRAHVRVSFAIHNSVSRWNHSHVIYVFCDVLKRIFKPLSTIHLSDLYTVCVRLTTYQTRTICNASIIWNDRLFRTTSVNARQWLFGSSMLQWRVRLVIGWCLFWLEV